MTHNGFHVTDSDLHVLEPPGLWQRYIDPKFKDRAPVGMTNRVRTLGVHFEGRSVGQAQGVRASAISYQLEQSQHYYEELEQRHYDGVAMLQAMDTEGIDVAALYPSRGLLVVSTPDLDPELFAAVSRA